MPLQPPAVSPAPMTSSSSTPPARAAERLAVDFLRRVWSPPHDLDAIDAMMTEDYIVTSGGREARGREAFKEWVREVQRRLLDATGEIHDVFADERGERVVARWTCRGYNNGILGLAADGRPVAFTGIAIFRVRDGRMAECWVERAALEALRRLTTE